LREEDAIVNVRRLAAFLCGIAAAAALVGADVASNAPAVLQTRIESNGLVGVSAAVSKDGQIVWEGGAGFRDREAGLPANAEMVHRIASITKSMTAVAAMQLVEQGTLDLDAALQQYIPAFPPKDKGTIRIRHLLTHTSGIRHYRVKENRPFKHYANLDDAMKLFWDRTLAAAPGERFVYTTYGYTTLGAVIERVSGQSYAGYMSEHVWTPAGMAHTGLEIPGASGPNRSKLYRKNREGVIEPDDQTDLSVKYPGGGVISTAGDLVRFANAFESGSLVKQETRERMLVVPPVENRRLPYAMGWMVWEDERFGDYYQNDGGQSGTSTYLAVFPEQDIAVAVIGNVARAGSDVREIAFDLVALLIDE
jgi:CubicO group peptidase (beta-lactamase class C family)